MPQSDLEARLFYKVIKVKLSLFMFGRFEFYNKLNLVSQMFLSSFTIYNKYISSLYSLIYIIMESEHNYRHKSGGFFCHLPFYCISSLQLQE